MGLFRNIFRIVGKIYISVKYFNSKSWRKYYAQQHLKDVCGKVYQKQFKNEFDVWFRKSEISRKNILFARLDYWLCFLFLGANPENYFEFYFYNRSWCDRRKHVTQFDLNFVDKWFNDKKFRSLLDNKAQFDEYYKDFVRRKWCVPNETSKKEFINLFGNSYAIIVKTQTGLGGRGVHLLSLKDIDSTYRMLTSYSEPIVVEEYINQKGMLHDFNPSSLNTIRVTTIRNAEDIHICHAFLRVGVEGRIVDNFHSGGIQFPLDSKTGEILVGSTFQKSCITHHPDSGIPITGLCIPKWLEIIDFVKKAHVFSPEGLHLIGWDVCLSGDEISLIEGNNGPGFPPIATSADNYWKDISEYLDKIWISLDT